MPPNNPPPPPPPGKRKAPHPANNPNAKRQKTQFARTIATQSTASLAKAAGVPDSVNLATFLSTREFEIKALEDGMRRAKNDLSLRAFQSVPRDMRRRTASHNAKRVPGRLRKRAEREMKDDNAPGVIRHKLGARARLRNENAKKLEGLAKKKKEEKNQKKKKKKEEGEEKNAVEGREKDESQQGQAMDIDPSDEAVIGRTPLPKATKDMLKPPPKPLSKFKKRQIHKTWLPTHLWHAKRAKMTEPKSPLWRFAIPLSPTEKCYRPTHRASGARGAVAWDMSYMSTIAIEGSDPALEKVLRAIGIQDDRSWGPAGLKWRSGKRTWSGWARRRVGDCQKDIGPATVIWEAPPTQELQSAGNDGTANTSSNPNAAEKERYTKRHVLIRVHPSAFLELWTEVLRISKQQRPLVHVEDLRFDIGSIEITGPNSMEALLGTLKSCNQEDAHGQLFSKLGGVTNASSLPPNALFNLTVRDPRLYYPPRKIALSDPHNPETAFTLLESIAGWNIDNTIPSSTFFNHRARWDATRLPSQKALNRRKGTAPPGEYPAIIEARDPKIPILLYPTRTVPGASSSQGSFTLLAPWKCIQSIWYCLMHFPLSSGGNPRLGGLYELQQIYFEHGRPHFPVDYPGTDAGWAHELERRKTTKKEWESRPKGKRICFDSLDLGLGRKGEVGDPWANDFELLLCDKSHDEELTANAHDNDKIEVDDSLNLRTTTSPFTHMTKSDFDSLLSTTSTTINPKPISALVSIKLTLLSKGTPVARARIYKLPSHAPSTTSLDSTNPQPQNESLISTQTQNSSIASQSLPADLRQQWLSHLPTSNNNTKHNSKTPKTKQGTYTKDGLRRLPQAEMSLQDRKIELAQTLISQPALPFPRPANLKNGGGNMEGEEGGAVGVHTLLVPDETDLIGFVTTGGFNLAQGKGVGIGCLGVERLCGRDEKKGYALEGKGVERYLCIVRNVGETVGRLAVWEAI